ncbi:MAG: YraN family protein [Pseudomonadota bacterium]
MEIGRAAERAVVEYLVANGFSVVATNLRVGHYEIDIVARKGATIAIVEVRTRGTAAFTRPFGSLDGSKRRRIRLAGERLWRRRYRHDPSVARLRYDAASVTFVDGVPRVEYVAAAF